MLRFGLFLENKSSFEQNGCVKSNYYKDYTLFSTFLKNGCLALNANLVPLRF